MEEEDIMPRDGIKPPSMEKDIVMLKAKGGQKDATDNTQRNTEEKIIMLKAKGGQKEGNGTKPPVGQKKGMDINIIMLKDITARIGLRENTSTTTPKEEEDTLKEEDSLKEEEDTLKEEDFRIIINY